MRAFEHRQLPAQADLTAPDGSEVRLLCQVSRGSMAHFTVGPGKVSKAVTHRTVEEVWYFLGGEGRLWRKQDGNEEIIVVSRGTSITIPTGTHFQFRCDSDEALAAVGVTMPPWPGEDEAAFVEGPWPPSA